MQTARSGLKKKKRGLFPRTPSQERNFCGTARLSGTGSSRLTPCLLLRPPNLMRAGLPPQDSPRLLAPWPRSKPFASAASRRVPNERSRGCPGNRDPISGQKHLNVTRPEKGVYRSKMPDILSPLGISQMQIRRRKEKGSIKTRGLTIRL